jgi:hypothetical protein
MSRRILLLILITAVLAALSPARARTESKTYVANGVVTVTLAAADAGIGGYIFPAGPKPAAIKVQDSNGRGIGFTVCQEVVPEESEPGCGNGNDVSQHLCSNNKFQTLSTAFKRKLEVSVFIDVDDPFDNCDTLATTGTVTLKR